MYREGLEALASRWYNDATARADRILHTAVTVSKKAMIALMQEGAIIAAESVRSEVDAALAQVTDRLQDAQRLAVLNVVAACITLMAAGIVAWSRLASARRRP